MKFKKEFVFKSLVYKDGGSFTGENGKVVNYKDRYLLKLDYFKNESIESLELTVPIDSQLLVSDLKRLSPYDKVILEIEVIPYQRSVRLLPLSAEKPQGK